MGNSGAGLFKFNLRDGYNRCQNCGIFPFLFRVLVDCINKIIRKNQDSPWSFCNTGRTYTEQLFINSLAILVIGFLRVYGLGEGEGAGGMFRRFGWCPEIC
jgi:hypothetical protein